MRLFSLLAALCLLAIWVTPAEARRKTVNLDPSCNVFMPCEGGYYSKRAKQLMGIPFGAPLQNYDIEPQHRKIVPKPMRSGAVIGGRPAGCPHAFCGCGASLYLFGRIRPELNLAANWLRFPRAAPAPRMAAARRGHVMVLVEHRGGNVWLVHDSNSGGHMTRLHERSIAGYQIVNPLNG